VLYLIVDNQLNAELLELDVELVDEKLVEQDVILIEVGEV